MQEGPLQECCWENALLLLANVSYLSQSFNRNSCRFSFQIDVLSYLQEYFTVTGQLTSAGSTEIMEGDCLTKRADALRVEGRRRRGRLNLGWED